MTSKVRQEADELGGFDLIIVDTSAAYFPGDDENNNVQLGAHARRLRLLTTMPGNPCVVVACHPVKNAGNDNLLPRGGGAFIAEVDGNLVCLKRDSIVDLSWQGKFRGPDFDPVGFELRTVTADKLKDSKGRSIATVMAMPLSEQTRSRDPSQGPERRGRAVAVARKGGMHIDRPYRARRWVDLAGRQAIQGEGPARPQQVARRKTGEP